MSLRLPQLPFSPYYGITAGLAGAWLIWPALDKDFKEKVFSGFGAFKK
jgi:hypothetical protein